MKTTNEEHARTLVSLSQVLVNLKNNDAAPGDVERLAKVLGDAAEVLTKKVVKEVRAKPAE